MSLVEREMTPAQVAASQANGKKSQGPKTPEGKARVSLNALKTGAYAKTDKARREIMLRRGENPDDFEQLHQEFTEEWQPGYVTEAMLVKTIAEKSFDKAQLRAAWTESQLDTLRIAEIQAQRQELLTRRWLPGQPAVKREAGGLWLAKDSPSKFKGIFDRLDLIEKWCEAQTIPDEYPRTMRELYGECPSLAGEKIRLLIMDYVGDDEAAMAKAAEELPKWFEKERKDVGQERELYRREMTIREKSGPNLTEEYVDKKEAALERQIREHTRLLLQLKTKRSEIGNREQEKGNREQGIGNREKTHGASPSEPPEATSGVASPGQSAVATEQRPADVEPAPHAGPASSSQSAVATEPRPADEPTGRSEGVSFAANAENPSENPPTERKPVVGGQGGSKNEKTGQSNLVSAA